MKKRTLVAITTTLLLISACTKQNTNIQTINGTISSIDNEYICIDTEDGNGWAIYYEDGYQINDNVIITFDTLGTDDIYDDEIINIQAAE